METVECVSAQPVCVPRAEWEWLTNVVTDGCNSTKLRSAIVRFERIQQMMKRVDGTGTAVNVVAPPADGILTISTPTAAAVTAAEFNKLPDDIKWQKYEDVFGIWVCPGCVEPIDHPRKCSNTPGAKMHCSSCDAVLTEHVEHGTDPFKYKVYARYRAPGPFNWKWLKYMRWGGGEAQALSMGDHTINRRPSGVDACWTIWDRVQCTTHTAITYADVLLKLHNITAVPQQANE